MSKGAGSHSIGDLMKLDTRQRALRKSAALWERGDNLPVAIVTTEMSDADRDMVNLKGTL